MPHNSPWASRAVMVKDLPVPVEPASNLSLLQWWCPGMETFRWPRQSHWPRPEIPQCQWRTIVCYWLVVQAQEVGSCKLLSLTLHRTSQQEAQHCLGIGRQYWHAWRHSPSKLEIWQTVALHSKVWGLVPVKLIQLTHQNLTSVSECGMKLQDKSNITSTNSKAHMQEKYPQQKE